MREVELSSELVRFGVTSQEADLFVLLTRVRNAGAGGVTGSELARMANAGRVRTYQILDRLVGFGLVQVELGRPKRYSAENPRTAVRRLLALHESKLTELSHAEEKVAEALAEAAPLGVKKEPDSKGKAKVAVLRGISAIQSLLRKAMEDRDLRAVVNDESEDHVFTTIGYMARKPKSVRVVFATMDEKREPFEGGRVEISGYRYKIRLVKGALPTMLLNGQQCMMLFYESERYRPKPLSPVTVRTVVSSCVVIEGAGYVSQMEAVYDRFWNLGL